MHSFTKSTISFIGLFAIWIFFSSAAILPVEPQDPQEQNLKQERLQKRLELKMELATSSRKKDRIERRIQRIKYGSQGDALGLAALLGGLAGLIIGVLAILLKPDTILLVLLGLLLGIAAIIFGFVDLKYTDQPGQAWVAIVFGALALIAGIVGIILLG